MAPPGTDVLTLQQQLQDCLDQAQTKEHRRRAEKKLKDLWASLNATTSVTGDHDAQVPVEVLVMFAKSSTKVNSTELAVEAVNAVLSRDLGNDPLVCRTRCVQGWVKASLASGAALKGAKAVNHVMSALSYCMQALDMATSPEVKAQAPHLVYNVSVHYWNNARPMLREGTLKFLVPSLNRMVDALEVSGEWDRAWRIQYLSTLAMALDDAKQTSQAAARSSAAMQVAKEAVEVEKLRVAQDSAALAQVHKDMEAVRAKLRGIDRAAEAAYARSDNKSESDKGRAAAAQEVERLNGESKKVREEELAAQEKLCRNAETRLEASLKGQKSAAAVLEGLIVQRVYMARRGDSEGRKLYEGAKAEGKDGSLRLKVVVVMQAIKAGVVDYEDVEKEITSLFAQAKAAGKTPEALEALADLGLVAARKTAMTLALESLDIVQKSRTQSPIVRTKADLLKCVLMAADAWLPPDKPTLGAKGGGDTRLDGPHLEALHLARRAEIARMLERAVTAAKRLGDVGLFHECCTLAWNLCMPLLEPHLRKQLQRLFHSAAVELERIESPQYFMRAVLHTELAKMEVAADYLAEATTECRKALALDYADVDATQVVKEPALTGVDWMKPPTPGPPERTAEQESESEKLRPLDRFLVPLERRLALRSRLCDTNDSRTDQALLLIEQARAAKQDNVRLRLLERAANHLKTLDTAEVKAAEAADVAAEAPERDTRIPTSLLKLVSAELEPVATSPEAPAPQRKILSDMWFQVGELAWQMKHVAMLHQAVVRVQYESWSPVKAKPYLVLQAKMQLTIVESLVHILRSEGTAVEPTTDADYDPLMLGVTFLELEASAVELKQAVVTSLVAALRRAIRAGEAYLIENVAVYMWNYHMPAFKAKLHKALLPELLPALELALRALKDIKTENSALLTTIGLAVAEAYAARGETTKAMETCNGVIALGRPMQVRALVRVLTRASGSKGTLPLGGSPSSSSKMLAAQHPDVRLLEAVMALTLTTLPHVGDKEKDDALSRAISILEDDSKGSGAKVVTAAATAEDFEEALELRAELWVQVTTELLSRKTWRRAQTAAKSCIDVLPTDPIDRATAMSLLRLLRWLSMAECLHGRAIAGMIDPINQETALQNELRVRALSHFVDAAAYGVGAKVPALVEAAAKETWATIGPMKDEPVSRKRLLGPVSKVLQSQAQVRMTSAKALRAKLYALSFQCLADESRWDDGLKAVTAAFDHVPASHNKSLWKWKVVFMSKLGKSVLDAMAVMREGNPVLQARVWAALAKSATRPKQVLEAYLKIFQILGERFEKVEYVLEAVEWMLSRNLSRRRAAMLLHVALDTLLDAEAGDEDDESLWDEESKSQGGGSSKHSGSVMSNKTKGSKGSAQGSAKAKTTKARSTAQRTAKHATRVGSNNARSVAALTRASINKPDGYPVQLRAEHLDMVIRTLTMQAQLADRLEDRRERCLQAVAYIEALATMMVHATNASTRLKAHRALPKEHQALTSPDTVAVDPSKLLTAPDSLLGLAVWDLNPSALELLKRTSSESEHRRFLPGPRSVRKAPVTIFHLTQLAGMLAGYGLHVHAAAVLTMNHIICELASPPAPPFLSLLARVRRARALAAIGMTDRAGAILKAIGASDLPLGLDDAAAQLYMGDVEEREKAMGTAAENRATTEASPATVRFEASGGDDGHDVIVKGFEVRHLWADLAEEMAAPGQQHAAMEYLAVAMRHNRAYRDGKNTARCLRVQAQLDEMSGRFAAALAHLLLSLKECKATGNANQWSKTTIHAARMLILLDDHTQAESILRDTCAALAAQSTCSTTQQHQHQQQVNETMSLTQPVATDVDVDALLAWTRCQMALADVLGQRVTEDLRSRRVTGDVAATRAKEVAALYEEAKRRLSIAGPGVCMTTAELLVQRVRFTRDALSLSAWSQARAATLDELSALRLLYVKALHLLSEINAAATPLRTASASVVSPGPQKPSLPVSRLLVEVQAEASELDSHLARLKREHASKAVQQYFKFMTKNVAEQWLMDTVPPAEPAPETIHPLCIEQAVLKGGSKAGTATNAAALGSGLLLLGMREGTLDYAWGGEGLVVKGNSEGSSVQKASSSAEASAAPASVADPLNVRKDAEESDAMTHTDFVTQAEATLKHAITAGSASEMWSHVGWSAAALVDLYGSAKAKQATASLMQFQSCAVRPLLLQAFMSATNAFDRQPVVVREYERLRTGWATTMLPEVKKLLSGFLTESCPAWRRLDCSAPPMDIFTRLPPTVFVLCLQLNPAQDVLYAAGVSASGKNAVIAKVEWPDDKRRRLLDLQARMAAFRKNVAKHMLLNGDEVGQFGDLRKAAQATAVKQPQPSGASVASARESIVSAATADVSIPEVPDGPEEELVKLVKETEGLLQPLFAKEDIKKFLLSVAQAPKSSLILLLDKELLALPFEGLAALAEVKSVSRDFSLHMLNHRLVAAKEVSGGKDVLDVKSIDMTYVADPRAEDIGSTSASYPRATMIQNMEELRKTHVASWKGLTGKDHVPATWEWQHFLIKRGGGGFIYHGPGRMLAHVPPHAVAGLNAKGCQLVAVLDQVENDATSRRQSKLDTQKTPAQLFAETPLSTAILLSLSGVNAVVVNQWASSFSSSARLMNRMTENLVKNKSQLGESVRGAAQANVVVSRPVLSPAAATKSAASGGSGRESKARPKDSESVTLAVKTRVACNTVVYGLPSLVLV